MEDKVMRIVETYYNKQYKLYGKIIEQGGKYWLLFVEKDKGLDLHDDIGKLRSALLVKNFEKIEE